MGFVLDSILRKDLLGSRDDEGNTSYETINVTGVTESHDISGSEQGTLITIDYINGAGLNVLFTVEGSDDDVSYAPIADADVTATDATGTHIFDITNINANYIRVSYTFTSGSCDVYVRNSAKRRH